MKKILIPLLLTFVFLVAGRNLPAKESGYQSHPNVQNIDSTKLVVLWTSGEKEIFTKMVNIYLYNAKKQGWFDQATLIIWGPSAKLLAGDKELQSMVKKLKKSGVILEACVWCADQYGVTSDLKQMGVDVKGMGVPLTKYLKDKNTRVMVF